MSRLERNVKEQAFDIDHTLAEIQSGSEVAVNSLFSHLRPQVFRYFVSRTGDPFRSEDLTQETLISIGEHVTNFDMSRYEDGVGKGFSSWTFRFAYFTLKNHERREAKTPFSFSDITLPGTSGVSESLEQSITDRGVRDTSEDDAPDFHEWNEKRAHVLDAIPSQHQALFQLAMDGKTNAEIANELGVTVPIIDKRLTRLRSLLYEQFLKPAGFNLVSDYNNKQLTGAASKGFAKTVRVLKRMYTKDDWVAEYFQKKSSREDPVENNTTIYTYEGIEVAADGE